MKIQLKEDFAGHSKDDVIDIQPTLAANIIRRGIAKTPSKAKPKAKK